MTKNNSNSMQVVKNTPDDQNELITWIKAHKHSYHYCRRSRNQK